MVTRPLMALSVAATLLAACAPVKIPGLASLLPASALPVMRWDTKPEAADWTTAALAAVASHDGDLADRVPADIKTYCPGYATAPLADRRAFWVGLMSATAKHESGFNPKAVGGGGRYVGLLQISPRTASLYHCTAATSTALKDGAANLECAVRIFAPHVAADGQVAGRGNLGIARDWGPFHSAAARADIASWTAAQSYCKP